MNEDVTGPVVEEALGKPPDRPVGTRLLVEVTAEWRVETTVDLVSYFNGLTEADCAEYIVAEASGVEDGYAQWEFPMRWIGPQDGDGPGGWLNYHKAIVREDVDLDNVGSHVRERIGYEGRTGNLGASWTEQDYHDLCDHVPWMSVHRTALAESGDGALSPEDLARIPGPRDVPLSFDA